MRKRVHMVEEGRSLCIAFIWSSSSTCIISCIIPSWIVYSLAFRSSILVYLIKLPNIYPFLLDLIDSELLVGLI